MPQFSSRLQTVHGHLTFYFNSVSRGDGEVFHVSVTDRNNKADIFYMKEERGRWILLNPSASLPWIQAMEKIFEKEIIDHLKPGKKK